MFVRKYSVALVSGKILERVMRIVITTTERLFGTEYNKLGSEVELRFILDLET